MNGFEVTPEMMESIAKEFGNKIEEWNAAVNLIYADYDALNATFEGNAKASFDKKMADDLPKYNKLSETLRSYKDTIIKASADYRQADADASNVFKAN